MAGACPVVDAVRPLIAYSFPTGDGVITAVALHDPMYGLSLFVSKTATRMVRIYCQGDQHVEQYKIGACNGVQEMECDLTDLYFPVYNPHDDKTVMRSALCRERM
jgi:hypothetical protein